MTRTFCDRCGAECTGKIFHVHVSAMELTNKGEPVSNDEYRPVELCRDCGEAHALTLVPDMATRFMTGRHPYDEDSAMMAAPLPFMPVRPPPPPPPPDAVQVS
jgi:hypothetical protein